MKKIYIVILCLVMTTAIGCSESTLTPISEVQATQNEAVKEVMTESVEVSLEKIEEMVLLERDGLKITAKELVSDPIWGKGMKILIENNSEQNLGVQLNHLIVNNYMISDLFSSSVAAGKKANETIDLSSESLKAAGINEICEIALSFNIYKSDTYENVFDSEEIEIQTTAYGNINQIVSDDGKELFNQNGIRIVGKYVEENSFWGKAVLLFVENKSEEDVVIQCDNMSINGFMITPLFSADVNKNRYALSDITIFESDLEENDIEKVNEVEIVFKILNSDTYQTIYVSDPIVFGVD